MPEQTDASFNTDQSKFYDLTNGNLSYQASNYNVLSSTINSAFSTSLNVGHKISNNVEILTGLTYSDWEGEQLANYDVQKQIVEKVVMPAPVGSDIVIVEDRVRTYDLKDTLQTSFKYQTFEIPLIMRYRMESKKFNYFISSGLSTNLSSSFKGDNVSSDLLDGSPNYREGTRLEPSKLNLLLGVGVGYALTDNVHFRLEPSYRYGVLLKEDPFVEGDFSSWGIGTGLNFYF